jgi:hypothetical protein
MRTVQDTIASWRNLEDLKVLLENRYGVALQADEMSGFRAMGLPQVLQYLAQKRGAGVGDGDAIEIAETLARRLTSMIETGGIALANAKGLPIANLLLEHLTSPKIVEALLRISTVQALTNFIAARMPAQRSASSDR